MVLDHLIATVPDIQASHARLLAKGFGEAWPVGPFWFSALTSGIALGGANLELVQPEKGVDRARIDTLVLAPRSLEEGRALLAGLEYEEREKVESDPALLTLRGFPPALASEPQTICTNLYPTDPPYPFFVCRYAPFLRERLAPANFPRPCGFLTRLSLVAPDPVVVRQLFVDRLGALDLDVSYGERPAVTAIRFLDGTTLDASDL